MKKNHGFTRLEMFVLLVVCVLAFALLWPMFAGSSRHRHGHQMSNSMHLRGIHSGMVLYAQGNKDFFPGLTNDGSQARTPITAKIAEYGTTSTSGYDVNYRMAILLRGNYFSPEYMLSPNETESKSAIKPGENLTSSHFSFALLRISDSNAKGRRDEWKAANNSRAPVGSDRNLGPGAGDKAYSNHTAPGEGWRGSVIYNDNHAVFETSNRIKTEYGPRAESHEIDLDDLFADDADKDGKHGNDAAMVYQDDHTYVNQK